MITTTDEPRILLLGPVELRSGAAGLAGTKQRLVFALLARQPNAAVSVDVLVDALWPDGLPADASRALQVHISKLRRVLGGCEGLDATIEHGPAGYSLHVDPDVTDVARFESLAAHGIAQAATDPQGAHDALSAALGLWRGEPFGELADHPGLQPDVRRLHELHLHVLEEHAATDLALGRHAAAIGDLQALTEAHPLRERLWWLLVLALYRAGRQGEALAAYEQARRHLADELGVDPSPALRELHEQVLHHDARLAVPDRTDPTTRPPQPASRTPGTRTLAILPFELIGASDAVAPLAGGLHSDLITELSGARDLSVISRTSVLPYAGTDLAVRRVAAELGATDVLEGSLQLAGSRFRLSVRLIDGERDTARWVGSYDDEVTAENLFAIQADLAREIAASLSAQLLPPPTSGRGPGTGTTDLDAYRTVAVARAHFDLKTAAGFASAIEGYEHAARLDPTYLDAHAGLALSLVSADAYGHGDRHDLLPRAEQAVHRALAISPDSPEARTALGVLHVAYQDAPAAVRELERATRASPSHADAHNWLCWVHLLTGDVAAAERSGLRAAELDPRAPEVRAHLALVHAASGDPAAGLTEARRAREASPYTTAAFYEAMCLSELARHDEVIELLEPLCSSPDARPVPWAGDGPRAVLAISLAATGRGAEARRLSDGLDAGDAPFALGLARLALDEVDAAATAFGAATRLTAWPCLALHHHRELWARMDGTDTLAALRALAARSWKLDA